MFKQTTTVLAAMTLIGLAACEADEQTFEAGADLDTPAAVEEAPATPMTPDALPPTSPPDTLLPPIDPDTVGTEES